MGEMIDFGKKRQELRSKVQLHQGERYVTSEYTMVPDQLLEQARVVQDVIELNYARYIPPAVIEKNQGLVGRVVMLNDEDAVDTYQEWRYEEDRGVNTVVMKYILNPDDSGMLDRDTGLIHMFDKTTTAVATDMHQEQYSTEFTRNEAEYLNLLDLASNISLQYIDRSLSTRFRIAASSYYSGEILQVMRVECPLSDDFMQFHNLPRLDFKNAENMYGETVHNVAYSSLYDEPLLHGIICSSLE